VYELRTLAKQAGIPNCQTLNKPALIERLLQHWEKVKSVIHPQERFWRAHQTALWSILAILVTIAFAWFPWRYPWHTETLEDRLQREYPLGYVLCDVGWPGKQLKNMRFYPDEAVMQADWQDTSAEVDTT